MLIAKIVDQDIFVADHRDMLPDTSFGPAGPTVAQITEMGYYPVSVWKPYDAATEKFEAVAPYLEDGQVFTIRVVPKTNEDFQNDYQTEVAKVKAARAAAYREISDPLFFKAQRGEATMDEWLAKVEEIKAQNPDPAPPATPVAPVAPAEQVVISPDFGDTLTAVDSLGGA